MEEMDRLLEHHKEIRSMLARIKELLAETSGFARGEFLEKADGDKLAFLVRGLAAKLTRHEAIEARVLEEFAERIGPDGAVAIASIRSEHESIHRIFGIIACLRRYDNEDSGYSIRFAASNLIHTLERHLSYEEDEAFPALERLIGLAACGTSARS